MIVAVDVDEVLGQFVAPFSEYYNAIHGTNLQVEDFISYDFHEVWGGTAEEAQVIVDEFLQSEKFQHGLPVVSGALETLREIKDKGKINFVVVTSRQHYLKELTEQWLRKHYPEIFSEIRFGNHYAKEGKKKNKSELCKELGATVLIDDNIKYCRDCAAHGIKAILFDWNGRYSWSRSYNAELDANIVKANDWAHVAQYLDQFLQNTEE